MTRQWALAPASRERLPTHPEPSSLVDILERVLDKGIVVAGDIRIDLLDIELLTIRLRLLIASVDRAKEMGIDWWEHDPTLSSGARDLAADSCESASALLRPAAQPGRVPGPGVRSPPSSRRRARGRRRSDYPSWS